MLLIDDVYEYDPPEYINATDSIDNLILAIRNTLQVWLDFHTNPVAWAQGWALDDEWQQLLKYPPSNNYFSFDVKSACIEVLADNYIENGAFVKCSVCGMLWESGYDDCDCEDYECIDLTNEDRDYLIEWLSDVECVIDDDTIEKTMITKGFPEYWSALESTIRGVVEECKDAIQQFDEIEDNQGRLSWALNASSILHINGDICKDYGDKVGLDYQTVCKYRDNGLTALFSKDEIRDYINQDDDNDYTE